MKCSTCGHEQETGKFCVKCGSKLEEKNLEVEETIESIKQDSNTEPLPNTDVEVKVQDEEAKVDKEVIAKNLAQEDIEVTEEEIHKASEPTQTPVTPSATTTEAPKNVEQESSTNKVGQEPKVGTQEEAKTATQANVNFEKVKAKTKGYWNFITSSVKNPNQIFATRKDQFVNGLISAGIFSAAFMLTLLIFIWRVNSDLGPFGRTFGEIISYSLQGLVFILVALLIVAGLLLLFTKLFSPDYSFQEIITVYGTMLLPIVFLFILPIFIALIGEYDAATSVLTLLVFISIFLIPLYILGKALFEKSVTINPFYTVIIYFVVKVIVFAILFKVIEDTTIGSMQEFIITFF